MPKNDQSLNILNGMLIKYSWKNADTKNTKIEACTLVTPFENLRNVILKWIIKENKKIFFFLTIFNKGL